jgi:hypothetical protein
MARRWTLRLQGRVAPRYRYDGMHQNTIGTRTAMRGYLTTQWMTEHGCRYDVYATTTEMLELDVEATATPKSGIGKIHILGMVLKRDRHRRGYTLLDLSGLRSASSC